MFEVDTSLYEMVGEVKSDKFLDLLDSNLELIYQSPELFRKERDIDGGLVSLVTKLNMAGLPTTQSCTGHGTDDTTGYVTILDVKTPLLKALKCNVEKLAWKTFTFPSELIASVEGSNNTIQFGLPDTENIWHRVVVLRWDCPTPTLRQEVIEILEVILDLTITDLEGNIATLTTNTQGTLLTLTDKGWSYTSPLTGKLVYVEGEEYQQLLKSMIRNHVRDFYVMNEKDYDLLSTTGMFRGD